MSIFNKVTKTFQWGQHTVTLETGEIARQATGAVLVNIDDTVRVQMNTYELALAYWQRWQRWQQSQHWQNPEMSLNPKPQHPT